MPHDADADRAVERFLNEQIDTVPHLEALLLLWASRPRAWSISAMAKGLFVVPEAAAQILDDLARQGLIARKPGGAAEFCYEPHPDRDQLVASVEATYRRELIRVTRLIHSKPSAAVREFARAFRITKDKK